MPSLRADAIQIPKSLSIQPVLWLDAADIGTIRTAHGITSGLKQVSGIADKSGQGNDGFQARYPAYIPGVAENLGLTSQGGWSPPSTGQQIHGLNTLAFGVTTNRDCLLFRRPTSASACSVYFVVAYYNNANSFQTWLWALPMGGASLFSIESLASNNALSGGSGSPTFRVDGVPFTGGTGPLNRMFQAKNEVLSATSGTGGVCLLTAESVNFSGWTSTAGMGGGNWMIGGCWPAGYWMGAYVGELIIFPSNLSYADRATLEKYLMTKWGIKGP